MSGYVTAKRDDDPDFSPMYAWEKENPWLDSEGFESWYARKKIVMDRVWVGYCLPQFKESVWGWTDEQVMLARQLVRGLFCAVCGRQEDPGCGEGC